MRFGGLSALEDLNLAVPEGGLYGLIGPNGAGKTTVFNLISGFLQPTGGRIFWDGARRSPGSPPTASRPWGSPAPSRTSGFSASSASWTTSWWGFTAAAGPPGARPFCACPATAGKNRDHRARGLALLEEVGLAEAAAQPAGKLPYGHQRRLEIARALATGPRLLLLDEPAAGLNPQETVDLIDFHQRDQGAL